MTDQMIEKQILIRTSNEAITGADFFARAAGLAESFAFKPDERVMIRMRNSPDFLIALFAALRSRARIYLGSTFWSEAQTQEVARQYAIERIITHVPSYLPTSSSCEISDGEIRVFTSGSTSAPKACVLSTENLRLNALGAGENLAFGQGDVWEASLPFFHVGGLSLIFRALAGGGAVGFEMPATHVSWVPTQLYRLIKTAERPAYRAILLGGGAPSRTVLEGARGLPVYRTYGMSEMGSQVTTTSNPLDLDSSGSVLKHRELEIRGGLIHVRGQTRFRGYETSEGLETPFDEAGWFNTGDLGELRDGRLFVQGRAGRAFKSGGEFIHPETIEAVLLNQPGVLQARVEAKPDAEYGHRPVAFVNGDGALDTGSLLASVRDRLSGLHVPTRILPWPGEGLKDRL
jgi:O-succinylbenzoic acid--CoA ligase